MAAPVTQTREDAVRLIRARAAEIQARGLTRLALFGSLARGVTLAPNDIDVVVDVDPERRFSLLDQAGLRLFSCDLLGCETDVVIRQDLRPDFRARISVDEVVVL